MALLDAQQRIAEVTGHIGWDDSDEVYTNHPAVRKESYTYNTQGLVDSIILWNYRDINTSRVVTAHYYNEYNLLDSIIINSLVYTSQDTTAATGGFVFHYDVEMNMILSEWFRVRDDGSRSISRTGYNHDEQGRIISRQIGASLDTANARIFHENIYIYEEDLLSEVKITNFDGNGNSQPFCIQEVHDRYHTNDPFRIQARVIQDGVYMDVDTYDYWYQFDTGVSKSDIRYPAIILGEFSEWNSMIRRETGLNYNVVPVYALDNFSNFRRDYNYSRIDLSSTSDIPQLDASLYPNPTYNTVRIQTSKLSGKMTLELYDLAGRKLLTQSVAADAEVDISDVDSGIYVYKLTAGVGSATGKLVVK